MKKIPAIFGLMLGVSLFGFELPNPEDLDELIMRQESTNRITVIGVPKCPEMMNVKSEFEDYEHLDEKRYIKKTIYVCRPTDTISSINNSLDLVLKIVSEEYTAKSVILSK